MYCPLANSFAGDCYWDSANNQVAVDVTCECSCDCPPPLYGFPKEFTFNAVTGWMVYGSYEEALNEWDYACTSAKGEVDHWCSSACENVSTDCKSYD